MNKEQLNTLKYENVFDILLFVLYKLKDDEKYSTLSELAYLLDYQSLLKLCKMYGGLTIRIPTLDEIELIIHSLMLYDMHLKGYRLDESIKLLNLETKKLDEIIESYNIIEKVMNNYTLG